MRIPIALSGAGLLAVAIAACSGGQSTNYVAPPSSSGAISNGGIVTLSQTAVTESAGTAGGVTGALTFGSGTGSVTSIGSATAPAGTVAVVPASKARIILASSATSPNVYYVTITSPTGATLSGLPAVSLSLTTPTVGTYQEAQWNGKAYANVTGATAVTSSTTGTGATGIQFPSTTTQVVIPANGSIYLAFYQGNYPNATPTPLATPVNVLADSSFTNATVGAYGTAVTTMGWTQCAVTKAATGVTPTRAFSTYTPVPGSVPLATIEQGGTALQTWTGTPAATQTSVPVIAPNPNAAVLGGVFVGSAAEDFRYNGLCQTVTVPTNATITGNVFVSSTDPAKYFDFEIAVLNSSGQLLGNIFEDANPVTSSSPGDTQYRAISVPSSSLAAYTGQTVQLFVGVWIDDYNSAGTSKYGGYYFVNDIELTGLK